MSKFEDKKTKAAEREHFNALSMEYPQMRNFINLGAPIGLGFTPAGVVLSSGFTGSLPAMSTGPMPPVYTSGLPAIYSAAGYGPGPALRATSETSGDTK